MGDAVANRRGRRLDEQARTAAHRPHRMPATVAARTWLPRVGRRLGREQVIGAAAAALSHARVADAQHGQCAAGPRGFAPQTAAASGTTHPGAAPLQTTAPNPGWPIDFKGQFKTRDGAWCFPLTVTDHFSRALLLCEALASTRTTECSRAAAAFEAIGVPDAIRTDNGVPFASTGLHGLTPLNRWWMQLGIVHQRIRPGRPQTKDARAHASRVETRSLVCRPPRPGPRNKRASPPSTALQRGAPACGAGRPDAGDALDAVARPIPRR